MQRRSSNEKPERSSSGTPLSSEPESSQSSGCVSGSSLLRSYIRRGLTIGQDNYADIFSDPELASTLDALKQAGQPMNVIGAHPTAEDDSVHCTVLDSSPVGPLTFRWWSSSQWGYCFDLVDLKETKVLACPEEMVIKLKMPNGTFHVLTAIEDAWATAHEGGDTVKIECSLNDDGIVEKRYPVDAGACIALQYVGEYVYFAVLYAPGRDAREEQGTVYLPTKP